MKKLLIILCAFSAFSALASEELYSALSAQETSVDSPRTEIVFQKSVGGITCQKTILLSDEINYECLLNSATFKPAKLYRSLAVEEVALPGNRLFLKYSKTAGSLTCVKVIKLGSRKKYSCIFKI